jgi:hypothetical protein
MSFAGIGGTSGQVSGTAPTGTFGIMAGIGCAGASCTTNTIGTHGEVVFIPEI